MIYKGHKIVVNDWATERKEYKQWYFPISKKKRIQKKLRKKDWCYGTFTKYSCFKMNDTKEIIMHSKIYEKIKDLIPNIK